VSLATLILEGRNIGEGPSAKYGWGEIYINVINQCYFSFAFFNMA
jgi:hypothetical protein